MKSGIIRASVFAPLPGGTAIPITVQTGHSYELHFKYDVNVPFGSDPPFTIGYSATAGSLKCSS